jgi:hypothetical protein
MQRRVQPKRGLSLGEGPHAGILRRAQYRSVRGLSGGLQSYRGTGLSTMITDTVSMS